MIQLKEIRILVIGKKQLCLLKFKEIIMVCFEIPRNEGVFFPQLGKKVRHPYSVVH